MCAAHVSAGCACRSSSRVLNSLRASAMFVSGGTHHPCRPRPQAGAPDPAVRPRENPPPWLSRRTQQLHRSRFGDMDGLDVRVRHTGGGSELGAVVAGGWARDRLSLPALLYRRLPVLNWAPYRLRPDVQEALRGAACAKSFAPCRCPVPRGRSGNWDSHFCLCLPVPRPRYPCGQA
jgi:hypothetical protein